jgi:hypothetical protein
MAPAYNETIHGLDGLGACFQDVREGIIGMLLNVEVAQEILALMAEIRTAEALEARRFAGMAGGRGPRRRYAWAPLRHADRHRECPKLRAERKRAMQGQSDAIDPNRTSGADLPVACSRFF